MSVAASAIRTAQRVDRFTYAIRNIVAEAKKVEAAGKKVRYLNIGDPNQFGFLTPPHLIEAVIKAMRDGHNGYVPSPGIVVSARSRRRGFRVARRQRVRRSRVDHVGHVGRHRARADRHRRRRRRSAGAVADVSALHRGAREDRRAAVVLSHRSHQQLAAGSRSPPEPDQSEDARAGRDRSEQSDRRDLSRFDTPGADRDRRDARPRHPRRRGLRRSLLRRPGAVDGGARQRRADHFLLEPVEGVPRARLARRMDGRGIDAASRSRAGRDQETRRRPPVQPRTDAIRGDRGADRRSIAPDRIPAGAARARRADDQRA